MRTLVCAALAALLLVPSVASAQQDRVTFGGDAHVHAGEVVNDVVTFGGDAVIDGDVRGDVVTMGGDALIRGDIGGDTVTMGGALTLLGDASVDGDAVTMGGEITMSEEATVHGEVVGFGGVSHLDPTEYGDDEGEIAIDVTPAGNSDDGGFVGWVVDALQGLVSYGLLFLLGLILMGLARERLDALQLVIVKQPARSAATGILGFLGAIAAIIVLAITVIGIPIAIVLALALPLAVYIGMAASATIIGAGLPLESLSERPILQLGAGVFTLWIASLVPYLGTVIVLAAAVVGLGALVVTRFAKASTLGDLDDSTPNGPYRTQSA